MQSQPGKVTEWRKKIEVKIEAFHRFEGCPKGVLFVHSTNLLQIILIVLKCCTT